MSDPMISTGDNRPHHCDLCGIDTTQNELRGVLAGGVHWMTDKHDAPCGLPYWGASVPIKAYRLGEYHRSPSECPRCGKPIAQNHRGRS